MVISWTTWRRHLAGRFLLCLVVAMLLVVDGSRSAETSALNQSVWLINSRVAVQIFDCSNLLCGRILWLRASEVSGKPELLDKHNPDRTLRNRRLCGLTIFWGLHSTMPDQWGGGRFYNPDDGTTYRISAKLRSADLLVARIYIGIPLFGRTKLLHRVAHGISAGWC